MELQGPANDRQPGINPCNTIGTDRMTAKTKEIEKTVRPSVSQLLRESSLPQLVARLLHDLTVQAS